MHREITLQALLVIKALVAQSLSTTGNTTTDTQLKYFYSSSSIAICLAGMWLYPRLVSQKDKYLLLLILLGELATSGLILYTMYRPSTLDVNKLYKASIIATLASIGLSYYFIIDKYDLRKKYCNIIT